MLCIAPCRTDSDSVIRWFESSYPSQNGQIRQKRLNFVRFFCFFTKKCMILNFSFWEVGSKLGSFWEVNFCFLRPFLQRPFFFYRS